VPWHPPKPDPGLLGPGGNVLPRLHAVVQHAHDFNDARLYHAR
jgi:hypothetical protein